ncbi:1-phosphofructokinase family hexose kinase [Isoptericola sp. BMS4]|uniref:1-phosphofructokinase family hexose kinase n=1 Tax=Isoptericola sp. BMS4 TaxID=2527875 RepID=UPI0014216E97|nr:PfkB family carbohydrate kinase [Isoptericola sp. BMS4]
MIVTVTPNPAVDVTYVVPALTSGTSLRVDAPGIRAGGKGVNVARVLRQDGHDALAVVTAGGTAGRDLVADLDASGLPYRAVPVGAETRRSVAIVDRAAGDTTILNEHGTALAPGELAGLHAAVAASLDGATCLVASGSLPPGAPAAFYGDLVRRAHEAGVPALVDAVGEPLLAACAAGADLVKPNRDELAATTGTSDPAVGARALLDAGARHVVVTLGGEGMLAVRAERPDAVVRARLRDGAGPLKGNPTGAGDAAVAAAAVTLSAASGAPGPDDIGDTAGDAALRALLRRAVAWSAAAVLAPLAGELAPGYRELARDVVLDPS